MQTDAGAFLQLVFDSVFGRHDIRLRSEMTAADVIGWDSIKQLDIIMEIEDRLGVQISGARLDRLRSVGDLKDLVADMMASSSERKVA